MTQVFISYSRKDLTFVEQLASDLKKSGLDVWYDVSGIAGGDRWRSEIENALRNSQYVLVVLSPDSINSEWVEREFLFSSNLKRKIIPLMYRPCELPLNYVNLNFINVQGDNYTRNFNMLLKALGVDPSTVDAQPVEVKQPSRKPRYLSIALIGGVAIVLSVLLASPLFRGIFVSATTVPTSIIDMTLAPTSTVLSIPSSATARSQTMPEATNSPMPTVTPTPEPGYELVPPNEVLNIAPKLRTFGQLAVEKYSIEERNKTNNTLTFTVNSTPDNPILWRWFWCAANDRILEQNMNKIDVIFEADGRAIPEDQLAQVVFENADPIYKGWKCFTYETVLRNWRPGIYKFIQIVTVASDINDGDQRFEAGVKTYEYTVHILPPTLTPTIPTRAN